MQQVSATAPAMFGVDPFWVAITIFALTYLLVIADRINRSIIALLGAGLMVVSGVLSQDEAIRGIDFNTIALLTGMMVLVAVSRRCGMFEYFAVWSAQKGRAQPWAILAMLSLVTAVVSAFLDNVTTVLLVAPVTLEIARHLEAPPYPFLFAEVFASNIGGTATLIGDPPNIIIGSAANLSFNDFVVHLAPVILVVMAVQLVATHLIWGRRMHASAAARAHVMALDERAIDQRGREDERQHGIDRDKGDSRLAEAGGDEPGIAPQPAQRHALPDLEQKHQRQRFEQHARHGRQRRRFATSAERAEQRSGDDQRRDARDPEQAHRGFGHEQRGEEEERRNSQRRDQHRLEQSDKRLQIGSAQAGDTVPSTPSRWRSLPSSPRCSSLSATFRGHGRSATFCAD